MFHLIFNIRMSDLECLRETFYRHDLVYLQSPRSEKKMIFLRKCLTIFGFFDGLWSVGTRFRH